MSDRIVVYKQEVTISQNELQEIIDILNRWEEVILTIDQVISNERLLTYLCKSIIDDRICWLELEDFWNKDGWSDIQDYI